MYNTFLPNVFQWHLSQKRNMHYALLSGSDAYSNMHTSRFIQAHAKACKMTGWYIRPLIFSRSLLLKQKKLRKNCDKKV